MSSHKGIRNDRIIECSRCGKHISWKIIDQHWITYQNGGKGHPTISHHITPSQTVKSTKRMKNIV